MRDRPRMHVAREFSTRTRTHVRVELTFVHKVFETTNLSQESKSCAAVHRLGQTFLEQFLLWTII